MAEEKEEDLRELEEIRRRLREGKIDREDLRRLERLVANVERASKALRAAIVE